jgi:hypothetical protein
MIRSSLCLALLLTLAGDAAAVQTESYRYARMEDYQDCSFRELILADDGSWRLGLRWEEMLADEMAFFSELADDGETLLLAGGGSPGKLILFDKQRGRHELVFSAEELLFSCAETLGPGDWVAGSGPGGALYRVNGEGVTTLYLETGEDFIWDLQRQGDQLWIATGSSGKLFRHDLGKGETELVATLPDQSVFSLALDEQGRLLAGSSGEGLLYRVGDEGELELLADFDAEEVQQILPLPGGDLMLALARTDEDCESGCAAIYRLDGEGRVEKMLSSDSAFIGDLLPAAAGGVWVAAGNPAELDRLIAPYRGEVHAIEADRFYSDLHHDGEALWLLQSKPARLLRLTGQAQEGMLSSEVLDLGNRCRAGALRLESDLPRGCRLEVEARSGHGAEPGQGWSEWRNCRLDESGLVHRMDLPAARFFQWRIRFVGKGDRSPHLYRVTASFLPLNRSPLLGNLSLLRPEDGPFEESLDLGGRPFTQVLERGVRVQYQQKNGAQLAGDPDPAPLRGLRQIQWDWLDPDGDRLRARLEFRRQDNARWQLLVEDLEQSLYTWDCRGLPDGAYHLRLTADDGLDNSRGRERSSELLSERLLLDSSPPSLDLKLRLADGRLELRGEVHDEGGGIVAALQWRRGEQPWQALTAADGLMDRVRVKLDLDLGPAEGSPFVELRARDEFGNWGYLRRELERE